MTTLHSIDVLPYRYTDNPNNYPEDYPALAVENKEEVILQPNWIRFTTIAEYNDYIEQNRAAFEAVITQKNKIRKQGVVWERIKQYRDFREEGGVEVLINGTNYWFHSDVKSQIKYLFLLFLATVFSTVFPSALKWKTMGGSEVQLGIMDVIAVFFKIIYIGQVVFEVGRIHQAAMMQVDDPDTHDYTTGWPPIYGE